MMYSFEELYGILDEVSCEPYEIVLRSFDGGNRFYLQVHQKCTNTQTKDPYTAKGRKWFVSRHSTRGEVVQTALLAIIKFAEHEIREAFLYKERAIFNTHLDLDVLWDHADQLETRD